VIKSGSFARRWKLGTPKTSALKDLAKRAGDTETVATAQRIAGEERQAAERIAGTWDVAIEAALERVGADRRPGARAC
jgi:hypothetical protein